MRAVRFSGFGGIFGCSPARKAVRAMATFVTPSRWQDEISEQELRECLSIPDGLGEEERREIAVPAIRVRGHTRALLMHAIVDESMTLENLLHRRLFMPKDIVDSLIRFGAVHWSRVPPEIPLDAGVPHADAARKIRQVALETLASSGDMQSMSQKERARLSKSERVLDGSKMIPAFSYIRVHMVPKRFPVFYGVDWARRVIAQGNGYIVMNKPSGLPVPPTVDNIRENVLMGASVALKRHGDDPLYITSRIDQPTEGIVVIGKNPEFVRRFNDLIIERSVQKKYKAAVVVPATTRSHVFDDEILGNVRHSARVNFRLPGLPFLTLVTGPNDATAVECHMIINSVVELDETVSQRLKKRYDIFEGDSVFEIDIDLITGRTHQIRCQLSAMGLPIIGDTLYGPLSDEKLRIALLEDRQDVNSQEDRNERILCEPYGPIALQAYQLHFDSNHDVFDDHLGQPVTFEIEAPWWH